MKYNSLYPVNDRLSVQRLPIPRGVFNADRVESREENRRRCQVKTWYYDRLLAYEIGS